MHAGVFSRMWIHCVPSQWIYVLLNSHCMLYYTAGQIHMYCRKRSLVKMVCSDYCSESGHTGTLNATASLRHVTAPSISWTEQEWINSSRELISATCENTNKQTLGLLFYTWHKDMTKHILISCDSVSFFSGTFELYNHSRLCLTKSDSA